MRRIEYEGFPAEWRAELSGIEYKWETDMENMSSKQWVAFSGRLCESALNNVRVRAIDEQSMPL